MVSELDLINVCNILVNIKLLNGVCPQSPCTGCQQFAPPQNPNDGEYTSSFEGTFVGPANGQPNGQGNPQQQLGYNELNAGNQQQIGGQQPNGQPILYPAPEFNQPGQQGQQVNAGGVYQGSANGQPNGNGQYMDQTQSPYNYNTVHPNSGYDASAQYPVTGTAAGNGQSSPTAFQYTTPYNPNNQNQQFTTASPSQFNDPQTTQGYPQTSSYNNQQFDTQGQQQFSDGPALTANHADMNYQYSKGVDGGSTLVPQMMGSTQPYSLQQTQRQNTGAPASTNGGVGTGTNNRLYDHGDMNAQYGQYDTTNTANAAQTVATVMATLLFFCYL
ncbi:unnamed protein product, partial [Mesorhabditis spiculigera]